MKFKLPDNHPLKRPYAPFIKDRVGAGYFWEASNSEDMRSLWTAFNVPALNEVKTTKEGKTTVRNTPNEKALQARAWTESVFDTFAFMLGISISVAVHAFKSGTPVHNRGETIPIEKTREAWSRSVSLPKEKGIKHLIGFDKEDLGGSVRG